MIRFLNATHKLLFTIPLGDDTWFVSGSGYLYLITHSLLRSAARWQDLVLTVHWLLEFHPSGQEQLLWDLAEMLHQQVVFLLDSHIHNSLCRDLTGGSGLKAHHFQQDQLFISLSTLMELTMDRQ